MNAQEMWNAYSARENISGKYDAWSFGDDPDGLAKLVLEGVKTGTASAFPLYALEGEDLPKAGEHNVILDSSDNAVCVTKTTNVYVVPFRQVSAEHAKKEGEGDRSLEYWRRVHETFFREEMHAAGLPFDWEMPVVCEEFAKVYP